MKIGAALVIAWLVQVPGYACDIGPNHFAQANTCQDATIPRAGLPLAHALSVRDLLRTFPHYSLSMAEVRASDKRFQFAGGPTYESAFARAIARAAKRSASELALEAATRIIVMCQKERNPALTTPFFRSDSQQAHCFRY